MMKSDSKYNKLMVPIARYMAALLLLGSCGSPSIVGKYTTRPPSLMTIVLKKINNEELRYLSGGELEINSDSTFVYQNCNAIVTNGIWRVNAEKELLLFCRDYFYLPDTAKTVYYCDPTGPAMDTFRIRKGALYNRSMFSDGKARDLVLKKE